MKIRTLLLLIIGLIASSNFVMSQDVFVNFTASGHSSAIDSIYVENLTTNNRVRIGGDDLLELVPAAAVRLLNNPTENIALYPNPADQSCRVDIEISQEQEACIEIFDVSGKLLITHCQDFSEAVHSFDISGLGGGIYYFSLSSNFNRYTTKIVSLSANSPNLSISYAGSYSESEDLFQTKDLLDNYNLSYNYGDVILFEAVSDLYHHSINTLIINEGDEIITLGEFEMEFLFYDCQDPLGNNYSIVNIGSQVWMAENLGTNQFADASSIEEISDSALWIAAGTGAYCNYNNSEENAQNMGRLYNWYAVSDSSGLCPIGWTVPSDADWSVLEEFLGMSASTNEDIGWRGDNQGCFLKEAGTEFWESQIENNINSTGFGARPAGIRNFAGNFYYLNQNATWWTSTENIGSEAWCRALQFDKCEIYREDGDKNMGFSVRCIKIPELISLPSVSTDTVYGVTSVKAMVEAYLSENGSDVEAERGFVWSLTQNPTVSNNEGLEDVGIGIGNFSYHISGLQPNTTYYVRAFAENSAGVAYGEEKSFTTLALLYTPGDGVTDIDNNFYNSIVLNGTEWMASNLRVTQYKDTTQIPKIIDASDWTNNSSDAYCWYENDSLANSLLYGALYTWTTVETSKLCPMGWHVPDSIEWITLIDFLGGAELAGGTMKEEGLSHWLDDNTGAVNTSGFTGLPGGYRETDGIFADLGVSGHFWTSSIFENIEAYKISLYNIDASAMLYHHEQNGGFSVRCIKNAEPLPILSTIQVSDVTATTTRCGGYISDNGGYDIIAKGLVWNTSTNPDLNENAGFTENGEGIEIYNQVISGLESNTVYYIKAYATNQETTAYGNEIMFTTADLLFTEGEGVVDINDVQYETFLIGDQEWMSDNIRTSEYRDGSSISKISDPIDWENQTLGAYCWYNNDSIANDTTYSKLYNWYAVNSGKLCPFGWHVATMDEWNILLDMIEDVDNKGGYMKSTGTIESLTGLWYAPNEGANNESGYNGFPGGMRDIDGTFDNMGYSGYWWTNTPGTQDDGAYIGLDYDATDVSAGFENANKGFSVRCIKNDYDIPILSTNEVIDITPYTANVNCEITDNGGNTVTERGVVWSTATEPTVEINEGLILEGDGVGAYTCNLTDLADGTTYFVRAYAINDAGIAYGNELTFSSLAFLFTPGDGVMDYDGNEYETIIVNGKEYMSENLRTSSYNHGGYINKVTDNSTWSSMNNGAYCWYDNDSASYEALYGKLYNFYVMPEDAICPDGWMVMTDEDFTDLELFLGLSELDVNVTGWRGEYVGGSLKKMGTENWLDPNLNATNISGFSAIPSGYRDVDGQFYNIGSDYYAWAFTFDQMTSKMRSLNYNENMVFRGDGPYNQGFAIRCKKVLLAEVSTTPVTNITYFEAQSGGNITSDGGGFIYSAGVVWSTSPNPTLDTNEGLTEDTNMIGSFESEVTQLSPETTYYLRAYATNDAGTAYGEEETFTTNTLTPVFTPGSGVTDYDGNFYNTVIVNGVEFMSENLKTSSYNYGGYINQVDDNAVWSSMNNGAYCWYNNDSASYEALYGKLYNWYVMEEDEICPNGWSVMTDDDFTDLELFLGLPELESDVMGWRGEYVGGSLKEMGTEHWLEPNLNAINTSGYTALPSGYRDADGQFYGLGSDYYVWANVVEEIAFRTRQLNYNENMVFRGNGIENQGYSIRCKKLLAPEVNTIPVTNITSYFVQSGGEILSDGGDNIAFYGIVWSTLPNPTYGDNEGFTEYWGEGVKSNFNLNFQDFASDLTPGTTYYLRAYAVNSIGEGYGAEETFTTLPEFICGENITFTYNGSDVTYGTVSFAGRCWLDRDLGATSVPLTIDDTNGYGDLFQWGREDDGHQSRLSTITVTLAPAGSQPGHNQFIYDPEDNMDWNEDEYWNSRWTDEVFNYPTIADPCPAGWHVPSQFEWEEITYEEYWISSDDAFLSLLKIPAGGVRVGENGIVDEGVFSGYWTSDGSDGSGNAIYFTGEYIDWYAYPEFSTGNSVRCILNTNDGGLGPN